MARPRSGDRILGPYYDESRTRWKVLRVRADGRRFWCGYLTESEAIAAKQRAEDRLPILNRPHWQTNLHRRVTDPVCELVDEGISLPWILKTLERAMLKEALSRTEGDPVATAELLGITSADLARRLQRQKLAG